MTKRPVGTRLASSNSREPAWWFIRWDVRIKWQSGSTWQCYLQAVTSQPLEALSAAPHDPFNLALLCNHPDAVAKVLTTVLGKRLGGRHCPPGFFGDFERGIVGSRGSRYLDAL